MKILTSFRLPILILGFFWITPNVFGQQLTQYTQYFNNYLFYNPAFAGRDYQTDVSFISRQQWVGLDGAPQSNTLNFSTKVLPLNLGAGVNINYEKIGAYTSVNANFSVAGEKRMGLNTFRFGIAPAVYSYSFGNQLNAIDNPELDPVLNGIANASTRFDLSFGFLFRAPQYFVGLSFANILAPRFEEISKLGSRNVQIQAGLDYQLPGSQEITLHPSLMFKSDLNSISAYVVDLSLLALYKEKFFIGASYRSFDAIAPVAGYQWYNSLGRFRVTYSYDYTTTTISNVSNGSHEISVKYSHFIDRPTVINRYKNVRFL
ncbi:PorP/SprF family type IX secretion system membrane protein [Luteibaculum oceani]|uniref:PorP/SprF family type IX secretion system membrane protein n=1 Tax=Luteibaculum oceani TaxID=1294296 RepID=UPI00147696BB|nr:PorP/SprF family type IX secretion system membrane protein [Luteibaculum oceani]